MIEFYIWEMNLETKERSRVYRSGNPRMVQTRARAMNQRGKSKWFYFTNVPRAFIGLAGLYELRLNRGGKWPHLPCCVLSNFSMPARCSRALASWSVVFSES